MMAALMTFTHYNAKDSRKIHIFLDSSAETVKLLEGCYTSGKAGTGKLFGFIFFQELPVQNHNWKCDYRGTRKCHF